MMSCEPVTHDALLVALARARRIPPAGEEDGGVI